jgi:energy-coupling factor transporter transmembrane protein EcfT
MDTTFVICIVAGIALVLLLFAARIALRWVIRLVIVGLMLLLALGGVAWWWLNQSSRQPDNKPRPTSNRRASSERR